MMLGGLSTLSFVKGDIVHKAISNQITNIHLGRKLSPISAKNEISRKFKKLKDGNLDSLVEKANGIIVSEDDLERVRADAQTCIDNFIAEAWPQIEGVERLEHDLGEPRQFKADGYKVALKADLITRSNDIITITDWKTGNEWSDGNNLQMAVYSMYVMSRYNVPLENIRTELFYLKEATRNIIIPTSAVIETTMERIKKETEEIRSCSDEVDFPSKQSKWCRFCNYATICEDGRGVLRGKMESLTSEEV
jgi:CRISPR/Cas system-associated exonuclease Cas4 (RecB family)